MSVQQFDDEFLAENAKFPFEKHCEIIEYRDIIRTNEGNKSTIKCIIPIKGVPFCTQTRAVRKVELKRSDTKIIMDMQTQTIDAPFSDCFCVRETWIILSSSKTMSKCMFYQTYKIDFMKYTMFKKAIMSKSDKCFQDETEIFHEYAQKNGHFGRKQNSDKSVPSKDSQLLLS